MARAVWTPPISVEDLAYEEGSSPSSRDKHPVSPDSALVPSEKELIKDTKGSFVSSRWLF